MDCAHGDDGCVFEFGSFEECFDFVVVFLCLVFFDEVDFVLDDDQVVDADDFKGLEVFSCLGLGAGFCCGDKEERSVHDVCAAEHGCHEAFVAGCVNK